MITDQTANGLTDTPAQAAAVIAAYAPRSLSAAAAGFVREVVAQAAPGTPARAKALLFAAGKLACFGERIGLERSAGVLLCEAVIERFVVVGCPGVSGATRRTLRTNLRALARAVEPFPPPAPVALVRDGSMRSCWRQSRPATATGSRCTDGAGRCPPEDVGGFQGYKDLRRVLAAPDADGHAEMLDWLGIERASDFDPARSRPGMPARRSRAF